MTRFIFSLLLAAPLVAQDGGFVFSKLPAGSAQPAPRYDGAIAYDPAGRQIVLFGGSGANDLWSYSIDKQQWTELSPSGGPPRGRFGHTLIFDPVRRRAVAFAGQAGAFFSDVWAYDIAANSWQQLAPDGAGPASRYGHSAVYDPKGDRMVISHGFTTQGRFDDTWAFSFSNNRWTNITPSGARPLKRCLHHAVLDEKDNLMFLYGGCSSGYGPCPDGDLWAFDLSANQWTQRVSSVMPDPREHYGMAFDSRRGMLVVYGGDVQHGTDPIAIGADLWQYDPASNAWSQLAPAGDAVPGRDRHESAYAADLGLIFFFGGETSTSLTNDLLTLGAAPAGSQQPQLNAGGMVNAFSGAGGAVAPGEIVSLYGQNLGPQTGVGAAFDGSRRLPTSLGGVTALVNGIAAPLYFVRNDQINIQIPYEVAGLPQASLRVVYNGAQSAPFNVPVSNTAPGLFPGAINPDLFLNSPAHPAAPGGVLVFFATGQGVTMPASVTGKAADGEYPAPQAPVTLIVGGKAAQLLFIGQTPGTAGVMQINAQLPLDVPTGAAVPVALTIGGNDAQSLTVAIR